MISTQDPVRSRPAWRRRRRGHVTEVVAWSLVAVGLGWLLVSALVGLSSAI